MSQLATVRAVPRARALRPAPPRDLRVVVGAPSGHAGIVAACLLLLLSGFLAVLVLNTTMAKGAFVLTDLRSTSDELADTATALQHAVDAQSAPAELAKRALGLGMVPATSVAFLSLSDGTVLGVAEPASADKGFTVVAQATSAAPVTAPAPESGTTAPAPPAPVVPETGTTVTTEGTITRTTVTMVRGDTVETTVTSVDSATGATTSMTTRTPIPAPATAAPDTTEAGPQPQGPASDTPAPAIPAP